LLGQQAALTQKLNYETALGGAGADKINLAFGRPPAGGAAASPTPGIASPTAPVALADSDRTLDLRGITVEEALSQLEMQLDQSATTREDRIKIIHGHGTEALKKAVRTYLSRSQYVKKWKAGSPEQGGDGITWAELGES
jgi:DNA mismatch repair protein MutS2